MFTADEIEDGTGKVGAVVYGLTADPVQECVAYLLSVGKTAYLGKSGETVGSGANTIDAQRMHLIVGVNYVEMRTMGGLDAGRRVNSDQALSQPRRQQCFDGETVETDTIHPWWLRATFEAAELSASGEDLFSVVDEGREIKREKTGRSIETEWFEGSASTVKTYQSIERLLAPFIGHDIILRRS